MYFSISVFKRILSLPYFVVASQWYMYLLLFSTLCRSRFSLSRNAAVPADSTSSIAAIRHPLLDSEVLMRTAFTKVVKNATLMEQ